ncbi:MAG: OsmC family protein [Actinomycetota bacterium]|jgi:peroxiredoxin-like protein|nr:OsmC family protein [Actinomycetota bacterium]MDA8316835.1 OsmC family protein [Actinomycetota bacterium]
MTRHVYRSSLSWSGSTADYATYDRRHEVTVGAGSLAVSADAAFSGDPDLTNPEQMLVAAASSCQLLSFLALASRSGVEVVGYNDDAEGVMPESEEPRRITAIVLRPKIVVRGGTVQRVERLVHKAHQQCYIANSLNSDVVLEPRIEVI